MASQTDHRNTTVGTRGTVNLGDIRSTLTTTRTTFTRIRTRQGREQELNPSLPQADFVTLVSLVSSIYRNHENDLIPIQQFHPDAERHEDGGHTCIVSKRAISTDTASNVQRGTIESLAEDIVVKRTRESVFSKSSGGLKSFLNEVRIRTHPPIRGHPNIVAFKGVAWDFEDVEAKIPRPLLLEELAPQRSLSGFWRNYDFVRMTFASKVDLSLDIANGLAILHANQIVHGDVKPDNILIFPKIGHQDAFMAKLTDFGHSVAADECLKSLPAFTPQWSAPEAIQDKDLSFKDMVATDVYSYGLVFLSVMIGRSYYRDFEDYEDIKKDDTMLDKAMGLVEQEDRQNHDSDFELDTIRILLRSSLRRNASRRSLRRCTRILHRYQATQVGIQANNESRFFNQRSAPLNTLDVGQMICVGYQSFILCSHQLKNKIFQELQSIADNDNDSRQPAAAWELCICYFSGFGTSRDFERSLHWLNFATSHGVAAADAFNLKIRGAMSINHKPRPEDSTTPTDAGSSGEFQPPLSQGKAGSGSVLQSEHRTGYQDSVGLSTGVIEERGPDVTVWDDQKAEVGDESDSDDAESVYEEPQAIMPEDVAVLATERDMTVVSALLTDKPHLTNCRDHEGNTLLILAARQKNFELMKCILSQPNVDAKICNVYQESALHVLAGFPNEQIRELVPQLVLKGADVFHEALPVRYESSFLNYSTSVRCCPIFRSILQDNLVLLRCLLDQTHKKEDDMACRICEVGSRLRRIVAVALATFRSQALDIILKHLRTHKNQEVDLSKIEVWADRKLIPLWQVPFQSLFVKTLDLPESFFRAISYGEKYQIALCSTLSFVLKNLCRGSRPLSKLLKEAVKMNSLDAVKHILQVARKQRFRTHWFAITSKNDFSESPMVQAITTGQRDIFKVLCDSSPNLFRSPVEIVDTYEDSRIAKLFEAGPTTHAYILQINITQICLSLATTAAHQDQYFLNFVLEHADRDTIIRQPSLINDHVSNQPTCFLAQAILSSSLGAAMTISRQFPETWEHCIPLHKSSADISQLSIASMFPDEYLSIDSDSTILVRQTDAFVRYFYQPLVHFFTGEYHFIRSPTVAEYILLVGSYEHCAFLLKHLHGERATQEKSSKSEAGVNQSSSVKVEDGTPPWLSCHLTSHEYFCLLLGNLVRDREDRRQLWDLVRVQVAKGHPRHMFYLRLALRHGNNRALTQLLDLGWQVNGPFWAFFMTPLRLSTSLEKQAAAKGESVLKHYSYDDWKESRWGDLVSHKRVFQLFKKAQSKLHENFEELTRQNSETLRERGATMPAIITFFRKEYVMLRSFVRLGLCYVLVLPFILAFATQSCWKWDIPVLHKVGWISEWGAFACVTWIVGIRITKATLATSMQFFTSRQIAVSALLVIQLLLQHLVPFILVVRLDLGDSSGWGAAAFLPFIIVACEGAILLVFSVLMVTTTILCFASAAIYDFLFVMGSYIRNKNFRRGPFGIF